MSANRVVLVPDPGAKPYEQSSNVHPPRETEFPAGEHVWIVAVVYRLTPGEARKAVEEGGLVASLGPDRVFAFDGPGCWRCEELYGSGAERLPCPGQPPGVLTYVTPE